MPCVYEFIADGKVMYVGRSYIGFTRVFDKYSGLYSSALNPGPTRVQAFWKADEVRITVFDNKEEANQEEIRLIRLHKPVANITYKK